MLLITFGSQFISPGRFERFRLPHKQSVVWIHWQIYQSDTAKTSHVFCELDITHFEIVGNFENANRRFFRQTLTVVDLIMYFW